MLRKTLTHSDHWFIAQALRLAAERYRANASAIGDLASRAAHETLIQQFDRQADQALEFAQLLEAAVNVVVDYEPDDDDTLDTQSSASRQHYIDTGRYLRKGEALAEDDTQ